MEPAPEHHQIAAGGGEVTGGRRVPGVASLHEKRSLRAEGHDRHHRVVEPAHLAVAVHRDAVARVAVVREAEALEPSAVLGRDRLLRVGEHRMSGVGDRTTRAQSRFVDPTFVPPHASLSPRERGHEVLVDLVRAAQPAAREVDPRGVVELQPLERHLPVDRGRDVHDGQRSDACIERCQRVAA